MSTDFYSFLIRQFDVFEHADGTSSIMMTGIAADSATPEGGVFELRVNDEPVTARVHFKRHTGAGTGSKIPESIEFPGFTLRAEVRTTDIQSISVVYNGRAPKVYKGDALASFINKSGLRVNIDSVVIQKKKDLLIGQGWLIGFDTDGPFEMQAFDGKNQPIPTSQIKFSTRFDVERTYMTMREQVTGYHVYVKEVSKVTLPVTVEVRSGDRSWRFELKKQNSLMHRIATLNSDKIERGFEYIRLNGFKPFLSKIRLKATRKGSPFNDEYNAWFLAHRSTPEQLEWQRSHPLEIKETVSLIVAAFNTPIDLLEKMVNSVKEQTYPYWELCIADGSTNDEVENWLKAHPDPKIKWTRLTKNYGISGNMNAAADLATGSYIALYDHDDFLEPDTLYSVMKEFQDHGYDFVYTDEDKYEDSTGRYVGPNFKPDFSPALLRSTNYICHFLTIRKDVYDRAGGKLFSEYDGAQDYDLVLRLMDTCEVDKIGHIARILYHWRMHGGSTALDSESKVWAYEAGERALLDWSKRKGLECRMLDSEVRGQYHMVYPTPGDPLISIIIPSKDHIGDLSVCLDSLAWMKYRNFEILVIENNSTDPKTFEGYKKLEKEHPNLRVIRWEHPFNYSAINNFGVQHARGDYLLFLNNDTEALRDDLLSEMLGQAMLPGVGAVGAKLYYDNDTIQHNGVIIGHSGVAGHALIGQPGNADNYRIRTLHDVSAVTAACMMMPRKVFEEVGGFNEEFAVAYNDIDLCLRIRKAGYWIIQDPFAIMYHYESRTRGYEDNDEKKARFEKEVRHMYETWPDELRSEDPFYNKNLDLTSITYQLRKDDEVNPYINPDFLGEAYYSAGTIRPERREKSASDKQNQ